MSGTRPLEPIEDKELTRKERLLKSRVNVMLRRERNHPYGAFYEPGEFERLVIAHVRALGGLREQKSSNKLEKAQEALNTALLFIRHTESCEWGKCSPERGPECDCGAYQARESINNVNNLSD